MEYAPQVTFAGANVNNLVYSGEIGPNGEIDQLAWFSAIGNAQSAILQCSNSQAPALTLYGEMLDSGAQPTYVALSGTTRSPPAPLRTARASGAYPIRFRSEETVEVAGRALPLSSVFADDAARWDLGAIVMIHGTLDNLRGGTRISYDFRFSL